MSEHSYGGELWLTEEEALGLLEILLITPAELTQEQRCAIIKVGELCRELMRNKANLSGLPSISTASCSTASCAA